MYSDHLVAKLKAENYENAKNSCPSTPHPVDMCGSQAQANVGLAYSLRDEAQRMANHHREQADKSAQAATFFHSHPEFEEFIKLIRSGSIQF